MRRSTAWGVGTIVVLLIAGVTWLGTRPAPVPTTSAEQLVMGTSVVVDAPPANARVGVPVVFTWDVRAPVGATAAHTAMHWGASSHVGVLGVDVAPAASGYLNLLPDYVQGSFALPRSFTGAITFSSSGRVYYRAHALIDGKHYWSPEYTMMVE